MVYKGNIIFHIPIPLNETASSASGLRPLKMLKAFKDIGFNVDVVAGNVKERRKSIKNIVDKIKSGTKYEFCYSESSTMPTVLTEKHHFPIAPFMDFSFIKFLKQNNIPAGLFYRDVHWVFDQYKKNTSLFKRLVAIQFYMYDLRKYNDLFDVLFLPAKKMIDSIPFKIKIKEIHDLPPGCEKIDLKTKTESKHPHGDNLKIVYAGGIIPPLYDLTPLFSGIKGRKDVFLYLICRKDEFEKTKEYYNISENSNISVIHGTGKEIESFFLNSDAYVILWEPFEYLSFAYPYKLFEAITYDLPLITSTGTAVSEFVLKYDIGWVVKGNISEVFDRIMSDRSMLEQKTNNILKIKDHNTWQYRAQSVADIFERLSMEK